MDKLESIKRTHPTKLENTKGKFVLEEPNNVDVLVAGASELDLQYRHKKVFALGRSPLWLVDTARKLGRNGNQYEYLAFSGRMYNADDEFKPMRYLPDPYCKPTQQQLAAFSDYVTKIGLTQESITGGDIVIVERTHSGVSLFSFVKTLEKIGFDLRGLQLHIIRSPLMPILPLHAFFPCTISYQTFDHDIGREMANSEDEESIGVDFTYWKWGSVEPPRLGTYQSQKAKEISSIIDNRISMMQIKSRRQD